MTVEREHILSEVETGDPAGNLRVIEGDKSDDRVFFRPQGVEQIELEGERFALWTYAEGTEGCFVWLHATGFNSRCYDLFLGGLKKLIPGWRIVALDQRGHGHSEAAADPTKLKSWGPYAATAGSLLEKLGGQPLLGGHSMGGTIACMATAKHPHRVAGVLLVEPVITRKPSLVLQPLKLVKGRQQSNRMVESARARRSRFDSMEAAYKHFHGRGIFKGWPDGALRGYLEGGLRETESGWELRCRPQWEAQTFRYGRSAPAWQSLAALPGPVLIACGQYGTTFPPLLRQQALHMKSRPLMHIYDASHCLPMERPEEMCLSTSSFIKLTTVGGSSQKA